MKTRLLIFSTAIVFMATLSVRATYSYYYTENLASPNWSNWTFLNNSSLVSDYYSAGGYGGLAGSGMMFYKTPHTGGGEVSMTVRFAGSNGDGFSAILACPDPTLQTGGYDVVGVSLRGGLNGITISQFGQNFSGSIGSVNYQPHDGDVIRAVAVPGSRGDTIGVYVNDVLLLSASGPDQNAGAYTSTYWGVGASASDPTDGNLMASVSLGYQDTVAPTPVAASSINYSAYYNSVDLQWGATTDDPNGTGLYDYSIYRNGQLLGSTQSLSYSDTAGVLPSTPYTYSIVASDYHFNAATTSVSVRTPGIPTNPPYPSSTPEGRRVGVRSTGAYWGASGENIDVLSGNLSFAQPLLKAQGRNGFGVGFNLVYDSQNWRKDSGGVWEFGADVGYGYGWRLLAGSITPVWNPGGLSAAQYIFTDSTGAEYHLNQNNGNIWTSQESIYVWFDANANTLHFRDGSLWNFGCISAGSEPDSGVMYPTWIEDTNGNIIQIRYQTAPGASWPNSSSRITQIEDVRAVNDGTGNYYTYSFTYNNDSPVRHLTSITNTIGTGENYSFSYVDNQTLYDPFQGNTHGTTAFLQTATITNIGTYYQFTTNQYGELTQIQLPYKGTLGYSYVTTTYGDGRSFRELNQRTLSSCNAAGQGCEGGSGQYTIAHESTPGYDVHQFTTIEDPSGVGEKYWAFNSSGTYEGLASTYQGRDRSAGGPGNCLSGNTNGLGACKVESDYTWTQDSTSNSYIANVNATLDPGQSYVAQNSYGQGLDVYGNVGGVYVNNYSSTGGGYHFAGYSYLTNSNYTSRYIFNRLISSYVYDGVVPINTATIAYDCAYLSDYANGGYNTCVGSSQSPAPREWDGNYAGIGYRGNPMIIVTPSGQSTASYDMYGDVTSETDPNNVSASVSTTSSTNYGAPTTITVGGSLTTNMNYNSFLGLTNETGPNGTSVSLGYDVNARPTSSMSPFGATTTTTYNDTAPTPNTCAMVDGRWTQTNLDGLGRPILVLTGYGSTCGQGTTVSQAESAYGPCGCSPLGKLMSAAVPHAYGTQPSATTTYSYDGVGRTLSKAVVGSDTQGTTTYSYQGNNVTVTDPAGKWKTFTTDSYGNLVQVTEPNPYGGSNYITSYNYDVFNRLIKVTMPRSTGTQVRTWNYANGPFLVSATNPENGTVSYTYSGTKVATRTDSKGQQAVYSYDSLGRLSQVQHYVNQGGGLPSQISITAYAPSLANGQFWTLYASGVGTAGFLQLTNQSQTFTIPNYAGAAGNIQVEQEGEQSTTVVVTSLTINGHTINANDPSVYDTCTGSYAQTTTISCGNGGFQFPTAQYMGAATQPTLEPCQTVNYYYDNTDPLNSGYVQNASGKLSAIQYWGSELTPYESCDTTFTELYTYGVPGSPTGKRLNVSRGGASFNLTAGYTYDTEGRTTAETYPTDNNGATASLSYTFDSMGRLNTMTDNIANQQIVTGATYGPANELLTLSSDYYITGYRGETRTYNSLKQLTGISNSAYGTINRIYSYPSAGNNGKISSETDVLSGETVSYTYDALNRLATAEDNANFSQPWGQSFTYDGFGNLTQTNVIQGSAPTMTASYDANNHQTGVSVDANGNPSSIPVPIAYSGFATWDVENRLISVAYQVDPPVNYSYDASNHRVWRGNVGGIPPNITHGPLDEVTFWSISGQKLATYNLTYQTVQYGPTTFYCTQSAVNYYFGSMLIKDNNGWVYPDRLGSMGKFYPYGAERPSATTNGTEKFTGYFRDSETGNDYAVNRYESPGTGRFLTPDTVDGDTSAPGSFNRYAYVQGDPTNQVDPTGRWMDFTDCGVDFELDGCSASDFDFSDGGTYPGMNDCAQSLLGNDPGMIQNPQAIVDTCAADGASVPQPTVGTIDFGAGGIGTLTALPNGEDVLSFQNGSLGGIAAEWICATQPELCVVVALGGITIYVGAVEGPTLFNDISRWLRRQTRRSGKEMASDAPSWVFDEKPPPPNQNCQQWAAQILNDHYGAGTQKANDRGPGSEYNKIVKYCQRSLK